MAANFPTSHTPAQLHGLIHRLVHRLVHIEDSGGDFLLRLDDGRVIDTKGWNDWEWTHGVGLYGLLRYHQISHDAQALETMKSWFAERFRAGTPTKNVNTMAAMLTLAHLYEQTGNSTYRPYLEVWAEWVMHEMPRTEEGGLQHIVFNSENPQQLWDDTLMMCVLPLAKIGLVLNRPAYVEEAKRQFLLHVKYLADTRTGLWFHGWTFDGRHNFARALWARGNSWVTIAIPEFIELLELPPGDHLREFLVGTLRAQAEALCRLQDRETGLWHTLLDDPASYVEASATAGFAYGLLKGVRKRYLDASCLPTALNAVRGVIEHIDERGELRQVSFGTAMGSDLDFYRRIPLTAMPYGQAMAMLCLTEYLHHFI
ncbi:glycoside hydrolase family 88/105 protein [Caldimonas tepidiphila]|uniref:beta-galactosidase BglB n=1 Tax=Caldimonas tepidiphila TaxID=2315841 RepID=UPI000E5AC290|nr:glycoside hydrolase family 88 protein [Caldimonas tepidiphila]